MKNTVVLKLRLFLFTNTQVAQWLVAQWLVATSMDYTRRGFDPHTSPLSKGLLSRVVAPGNGCPRLYWVSSASCTMDMSVISRGILHVSLHSQQVEIHPLRKVIAIRTRRIEVAWLISTWLWAGGRWAIKAFFEQFKHTWITQIDFFWILLYIFCCIKIVLQVFNKLN